VIIAVLDTNVLASGVAGIARSESTPGEFLRRWRANGFILVVSESIVEELERTLTNPYFRGRLSSAEIDVALTSLRTEARVQPLTEPVVGVASHPEDDLIFATAVSARAHYLVTGDKRFVGARCLSRYAAPDCTPVSHGHRSGWRVSVGRQGDCDAFPGGQSAGEDTFERIR
jgi:putative PIN family toxin of toxin-antitoxin system